MSTPGVPPGSRRTTKRPLERDDLHSDEGLRGIVTPTTEALLDALEIGIVIVARDATIALANREAERMLGRTTAELVGLSMSHLTPEISHSDGTPVAFEEMLFSAAMRTGDPTERSSRVVKRADGTKHAMRVWARPAFRRGETHPIGAVVFLVDADSPGAQDDTGARLAALEAAFEKLAPHLYGGRMVTQPSPTLLALLTKREQQVVSLFAAGFRVSNVAEELHLSRHTVRNHLKSIFRKLGVTTQAELIQRLRFAASEAPDMPKE